jgi:hypothetical protein
MLGLGLGAVLWLFHRVPTYRRDRTAVAGGSGPEPDRALPGDPCTVQRADDGVGPRYHRRYWIDVTDTDIGPEELLDAVLHDLDDVTPGEISRFEPVTEVGPDGLGVGAELLVRLPGPWDGPVRLVERTPTSFRFATLEAHMEAGEILFATSRTDRGFVRFEIESWARSGDPRFRWLYERVPIAREIQLYMWARFCRRAARLTGGVVMNDVQVVTEVVERA